MIAYLLRQRFLGITSQYEKKEFCAELLEEDDSKVEQFFNGQPGYSDAILEAVSYFLFEQEHEDSLQDVNDALFKCDKAGMMIDSRELKNNPYERFDLNYKEVDLNEKRSEVNNIISQHAVRETRLLALFLIGYNDILHIYSKENQHCRDRLREVLELWYDRSTPENRTWKMLRSVLLFLRKIKLIRLIETGFSVKTPEEAEYTSSAGNQPASPSHGFDEYSDDVIKIEYWIRLCLASEKMYKQIQLAILHNKFSDPKYVGLPSDTTELYMELKNMKSKEEFRNILTSIQWDNVLPECGYTDSSTFSLEIIFTLIRYGTTLPAPIGGWDVLELHRRDQSIAAYITLSQRNYEYLTTECSVLLNKELFSEMWSNLEKFAYGMCGFVDSDFSVFKQRLIDHQTSPLDLYEVFDVIQNYQEILRTTKSVNTFQHHISYKYFSQLSFKLLVIILENNLNENYMRAKTKLKSLLDSEECVTGFNIDRINDFTEQSYQDIEEQRAKIEALKKNVMEEEEESTDEPQEEPEKRKARLYRSLSYAEPKNNMQNIYRLLKRENGQKVKKMKSLDLGMESVEFKRRSTWGGKLSSPVAAVQEFWSTKFRKRIAYSFSQE